MDQQKLLKFVQTLLTLKEKLKCPICLDVMQEVIELDCGHKYCEECYSQHKSTHKQVACPLCKKIVKRRSRIYKDSYLNALGKFVYNSCKSIQDVYKCEVEQLQQNLCTDTDPVPQVQASILKQNIGSNTITRTLPSTSKDKRKNRPKSKENCEDAFDKLMQGASTSYAFNKNATRRVYVNKKKLEKKPEYDILEFDNYENKTAVLRWLNDTRNLFDRLTQTQNFEEEEIPSPIVELESISQDKENFKSIGNINVRKLRAKSLDIEIKKPAPKDPKRYSDGGGSVNIENYNIEDINTEEEEVVKKVEEKVLLDLIEDEFLNKLDSELQNHQDSNGQTKAKKMSKKTGKQGNTPCSGTSATGWDRITKIKKTIKKSGKVPKQLNITLQSNQSLTTKTDKETNNLNSIEKTPQPSNNTSDNIDVSKRVLKVVLSRVLIEKKNQTISKKNLNVLQSVDKSKQGKNVRKKIEVVEQNKAEPVGLIDLHITIKTSQHKAPDSVETEKNNIHEKSTSYDFNKLEDYITKNMKILDKSLDSNASPHATVRPEKTIDKDVELGVEKEHTKIVAKSNKNHLSDSKHSPTVQKIDQIETKDTIVVDDDELFMMPTQKILNNSDHTISKEKNIVVDNDVKEISVQTSGHERQDMTDKSNKVLQDQSKQTNKAEVFTLKLDDILSCEEPCVAITQKSERNRQDITDVAKVSQHNNPKSKETSGKEVVCDDYDMDELYALPTQKIKHSCKDVTAKFEALVENSCSTDGLLHLFEESLDKCLESLKSTDVVNVEDHLHNLQFLVAKIKLLNREKNNEPVKVSSNNAATQTIVETIDEKVQTENKCVVNTEVQTEEIHCFKCNGDLNNVNEGEKVISQSTKTAIETMVNEPNENFKLSDRNASNIPKRNMPTSKPTSQNEMFTATFDNLNFETQELTKNQGFILRNSEIKSDKNLRSNLSMRSNKEVLSRGTDKSVGENLPGSILVCSLNTTNPTCPKKVNKKLTYDEGPSKRFKRIRLPTSGSDSEGEVEVKRKCNRFIRDDLTIEIHTNTERFKEQEKEQKSALESQDSENYDDYLAEILKKYDDPNFSTNSSNKTSETLSSRKKAINNKATKCGETIPHTNKNIQNIKDVNSVSCESSKDSFQTASQSINNFDAALTADNMFMDEGNLLKLEKDIKAYERSSIKDQNSEISDIIGATEELEPLPKRPKYNAVRRENPQSASLFNPSKNLVHMRQKSDISDDVCQELNDSLDEADLEIIEEQTNLNKANASAMEKIKIIENIKIKSQDRKEDMKEEEDDLFSDEDIVETTPQKKINSFAERSILSQIDNLVNFPLKDNLPTPLSNTENFEFDFGALPPPPDFQDDIQSPENTAAEIPPNYEATVVVPDITTTSLNKFSLTPDKLSQFIVNEKNAKDDMSQIISSTVQYNNTNKEDQGQNNLSLTPDKLSQFDINPGSRNMMHSTPVSQRNLGRETLGISPISARKSQQSGIIEMAQTSKFTPLSSITRSNPQKNTILTSTPGQKSIWNYVKQPSQPNEKEATPITKTKPCIACTRLTKDQIKSISQLTSKKLATYSSNFDMGVTHMIVAVNEDNCVRDYTIKFVSAVAAGIWVLRFDWIEECLSNNCIVPEEPFEALDISGLPGPRTSRLTRKKNPLFKGYKFYCANPFINTTQQEVEEIIEMLGGKILRDIKNLLVDDGNIGLIIGEGHGTQDFEHYERWVELYKTVTVDIEWLSKCVGQYKLISIRPYVWCSEDNLGDLGYPPFLTEMVPLSFTETF